MLRYVVYRLIEDLPKVRPDSHRLCDRQSSFRVVVILDDHLQSDRLQVAVCEIAIFEARL